MNDHDRPLGVRGRRDVKRMGRYLSTNEPTPGMMITSTASRALYTALFYADEWGSPEDQIILNSELYESSVDTILSVISKDHEANSIAIFGHNPTFTNLVNHFAEEYLDNLPTAAVCAFDFDVDSWAEINRSNATQKFLITPKKL